jgi:formylglycine-generating enzyme required for sulfatase activity
MSIVVPGGTFYRTYTNDGSGATNKDDPATLSDFRLDKYPVTVARYRQFVAAWNKGGGFVPVAGSGKHAHLNGGKGLADSGNPGSYESGWNAADDDKVQPSSEHLACDSAYVAWSDAVSDRENLPMNCVNWYEAYAFCIWDGGFLASEAEFEYAAAGGSEQRKYPWGSQDAGGNSEYAICNCNYPEATGSCSGTANVAPVGTAIRGAGRWGHLDLVGNVTEWNLDWFSPAYVNPCTDCAYVADGSGRVIRDGYFSSADGTLQVSYRNSLYSTNRFYSMGFRCARTP